MTEERLREIDLAINEEWRVETKRLMRELVMEVMRLRAALHYIIETVNDDATYQFAQQALESNP